MSEALKIDTKRPAIYEIGQYFIQNKKKALFKITNATWIGTMSKKSRSKVKNEEFVINDWLYEIEYLGTDIAPRYGRYYEDRLLLECSVVKDQQLPKAIYE